VEYVVGEKVLDTKPTYGTWGTLPKGTHAKLMLALKDKAEGSEKVPVF